MERLDEFLERLDEFVSAIKDGKINQGFFETTLRMLNSKDAARRLAFKINKEADEEEIAVAKKLAKSVPGIYIEYFLDALKEKAKTKV